GLGGVVEKGVDWGAPRIVYNSCRNRHCPKCQGLARVQWLADRQAELLPVPVVRGEQVAEFRGLDTRRIQISPQEVLSRYLDRRPELAFGARSNANVVIFQSES